MSGDGGKNTGSEREEKKKFRGNFFAVKNPLSPEGELANESAEMI